MAIPRIIHQTIGRKSDLSPQVVSNIAKTREINAGWEYALYQDDDIELFIRDEYGKDHLATYQRINPKYGAARADYFRYLLLYRVGGVYLDVKSTTSSPLDEILRPDDSYLLSHWRNGPGERYEAWGIWSELRTLGSRGEYQQWHIIAEPRHPFLEAVIARVKGNVEHYTAPIHGVGKMGVVRTTGPIPYSLAIHKLADRHPHRLVDHEEIGLIYSVFDTGGTLFGHVPQFKNHYSTLTEPVVFPAGTRSSSRLSPLLNPGASRRRF